MEAKKSMYKYIDLDSFSIYFSASTTQDFLYHHYQTLNIKDADQKSYENCYRFIYFLEHGLLHYKQAKIAPLALKPILLFYGVVHLIKACILTVDANYPKSTTMLAHGVSTRKRKKQQYEFFQDEVKLQKNGLFPLMAEKMFHMKHLEGNKLTMGSLLKQIPELNDLFLHLGETTPSLLKIEKQTDTYIISEEILDYFHMTESHFIRFFQSISSFPISILTDTKGKNITFKTKSINFMNCLPLRYSIIDKQLYLPLMRSELLKYPEILIHYLILYNLSMIARYETEWWSELIKMMPNQDFPFIKTFLNITMEKSPFLVYHFLSNKKEGNE
nr:YaaC family protein [Bacillus aquiflavi]